MSPAELELRQRHGCNPQVAEHYPRRQARQDWVSRAREVRPAALQRCIYPLAAPPHPGRWSQAAVGAACGCYLLLRMLCLLIVGSRPPGGQMLHKDGQQQGSNHAQEHCVEGDHCCALQQRVRPLACRAGVEGESFQRPLGAWSGSSAGGGKAGMLHR